MRSRWRSLRALQLALEHEFFDEASTCYFILSDKCFRRDAYNDALGYLDEALALARRDGNRPYEWGVLAERTFPMWMLGRWDEAQETRAGFTQEQIDSGAMVLSLLESSMSIQIERGELDGARRCWRCSRVSRTRRTSRTCPATSDRAPRCSGPRDDSPMRSRTPSDHRGRPDARCRRAVDETGHRRGDRGGLALGNTAKAEELLLIDRGSPAGRRGRRYLDAQADALPRTHGRRRDWFRVRRGAPSASWACRSGSPSHCSSTASSTGDEAPLDEAREIFESLRRRRGSSGSMRVAPQAPRCTRELPELRHREPRGPEVLLRVRDAARGRLPGVRRRERAGREVLRRVRRDAHARGGRPARRLPAPRPQPSAGSSPSSSPTSSASRRSRRAATPRRCASSSPATSTPAGA